MAILFIGYGLTADVPTITSCHTMKPKKEEKLAGKGESNSSQFPLGPYALCKPLLEFYYYTYTISAMYNNGQYIPSH